MEVKKELLKNLGGIAVTTGVMFATQGSGLLALGVLNGIAGNLAGSFIEKSGYDKIRKLLKNPHPSELNHDIRKVVVKAVEWSVKNIAMLYKQHLVSPDHKKELRRFTAQMLEEVRVLKDSIVMDGENLYKIVDYPGDPDTVLKTFDLEVSGFPVIDPDHPFNLFFKEQFPPNLKLCFGELLKDEENRPALIAYQREVFQSLDRGIETIIEQNNRILEKLDHKEPYLDQNDILKKLTAELKKAPKHKANPLFMASLDRQLETVSSQTTLLIRQNELLLDEINQVKNITKGISRDLKTSWLEKNRVYVMAGSGVAAMIILGLLYHLYTQPFQMVVHLEKNNALNIHPDYPPPQSGSKLRLYLPNQIRERELNHSNEIILNELHASLAGLFGKVELLDPFWKLSVDSVRLQSGNHPLAMEPNEALAFVEGRVLSRDGQSRIGNAHVWVDHQKTMTDSTGKFSLEVPVGSRKPSYLVRIEKPGYAASEKAYYPGSTIEFRLENQ